MEQTTEIKWRLILTSGDHLIVHIKGVDEIKQVEKDFFGDNLDPITQCRNVQAYGMIENSEGIETGIYAYIQKANGKRIINPVNATAGVLTLSVFPGGLAASICEFSD